MAYAPGIDLGTLKLIPEASRPAAWLLSGGAATTFTDVSFAAYTPAGVKALYLQYGISWTGNGVADYSGWQLRKNGSSETARNKTVVVMDYLTNLASGSVREVDGVLIVECDTSGIIEYRFLGGAAAVGGLYLSPLGYYL